MHPNALPETSFSTLRSDKAKPLHGQARAPGDKSISHRALMLSSQVLGATRIEGLLEGEDVVCTARALASLGVTINRTAPRQWDVHGVGTGGLNESATVLDMGNSGTGARLLMGLATPYPFTTFFCGDESLCSRPMKRVATPLELMGARFAAREGMRMPLALTGTASPMPITYRLPVASAQVKSAILLAGLGTRGETAVIEPEPTRDHTENMLQYLGFALNRGKTPDGANSVSIVGHQAFAPQDRVIEVPGDPSSAAFLVVAALIVPHSKLTIRNICVNPLRTGLLTTLKEMGALIDLQNERFVAGEPVADIAVASSALRGVSVPAERAPSMIDEYPILAVAAAFAEGESRMHGLGELRVKESDRLAAIVEALSACGVQAHARGDALHIKGCGDHVPGGGLVRTRYDHRIAMAFLVLGMASLTPVEIDDGRAIATSFPDFISLFNKLGGSITARDGERPATSSKPLVIAIDGPAASGKGTLARRIAEYFGLDYLDTGSLYRAVGMKLLYGNQDPSDTRAAVKAAQSIDADDIANPRLRQEKIGQAASVVSAMPEVRTALLEYQRGFAASARGAVLDGRDIGTVVCPDADMKFFLTATLYARARRRHKELQGQGISVIFESVLEDLRERDERDEKRACAPLKPAVDAVALDTSDMDASTVFEKVKSIISNKRKFS